MSLNWSQPTPQPLSGAHNVKHEGISHKIISISSTSARATTDHLTEERAAPLKTSPGRVCIVGSNSLFEEGLVQLLSTKTDLQVISVKYGAGSVFLQAIEKYGPSVVLINETALLDLTRILDLLFSCPSLAGLHIIVLRLTDNIANAYRLTDGVIKQERLQITTYGELINMMQLFPCRF